MGKQSSHFAVLLPSHCGIYNEISYVKNSKSASQYVCPFHFGFMLTFRIKMNKWKGMVDPSSVEISPLIRCPTVFWLNPTEVKEYVKEYERNSG